MEKVKEISISSQVRLRFGSRQTERLLYQEMGTSESCQNTSRHPMEFDEKAAHLYDWIWWHQVFDHLHQLSFDAFLLGPSFGVLCSKAVQDGGRLRCHAAFSKSEPIKLPETNSSHLKMDGWSTKSISGLLGITYAASKGSPARWCHIRRLLNGHVTKFRCSYLLKDWGLTSTRAELGSEFSSAGNHKTPERLQGQPCGTPIVVDS